MISPLGTENIESTLTPLVKAMQTPASAGPSSRSSAPHGNKGLVRSHVEYLAAVLERPVTNREANGTALGIRSADLLAPLGTTTFIPKANSVILLVPPGTLAVDHIELSLKPAGRDLR